MASDDSERQRRLAEALRANLRRRKAQARDRDAGPGPESVDQPDSSDSESPR